MIKNPINFTIGIITSLCFIINIINKRDSFIIIFSATAAFANIITGLLGGKE